MEPDFSKKSYRSILRDYGINLSFCTLIAVMLTVYGNDSFWENLIVSCCIGISIHTLVFVFLFGFKPASQAFIWIWVSLAIVIGVVFGLFSGLTLADVQVNRFFGEKQFFTREIPIALIFGFSISYFFYSREKMNQIENRAKEERINRLSSEKLAIENHLKLLQAQIEPHFLFNTLSNVLSLMDTDPESGKKMLENLTRYLRTALSRTRRRSADLSQELDLIRHYLDICRIRMDKRLRYRIDVPESLSGAKLPPLLLQPLVENAVRHGLEPKIEGGFISVCAARENDRLKIEISDTGTGMSPDSPSGLGIKNVRERLKSLYGNDGRLRFSQNDPFGVKAVIEVPYESSDGDHRG